MVGPLPALAQVAKIDYELENVLINRRNRLPTIIVRAATPADIPLIPILRDWL